MVCPGEPNQTGGRGANRGLDPARAPSQNVRITLTAAPDQGVKTALLFLKDDAPPELGSRTPQKTVVVGFLPPAAFADAYRVLQGEDPIFLESRRTTATT